MKIALLQSRVYRDRPAENLEFIKTALKSEPMEGVELAVFPRLCLSGRLGKAALARPALAPQYEKIWQSFLELSEAYPGTALTSTRLIFNGDGSVAEEAFAVLGGEILFKGLRPTDDRQAEYWPYFTLKNLKIRLIPGLKTPPPQAAEGADLAITFRTRHYQGSPFLPPTNPGAAQAWRLTAAAIGGDGPFIHDGATRVFDPAGDLKGWAYGFDSATIIFDTNSKALPSLSPQLPIFNLTETLYKALKAGLRDYIRNVGTEKVCLGLSGGLDSAVVAALAVDALGADKVLGVAMPSEYNAPESLDLARALAKNLGIQCVTLPIDGIRASFSKAFLLAPKSEAREGNLADENIQARIRGALLMYIANREDRLVLATFNKSEAAMGYSTLYGDSCGAIAPIGDVYKTRVFQLAEYINHEEEIIPRETITRPPSAELRPGQKDEDSLPPYETLDDILLRHLEGRQSGSQIAREGGHSPMTVAWILSSYKKSAYKRAQMPFALIASTRPLDEGLDWY